IRDAEYDAQRFRRWLGKRLGEGGEMPDVTPLIVFVREGAELDVPEMRVPVLLHKQLKGWIRRADKECQEPLDVDRLYRLERVMLGDKVDEL
ncbi:MAG: hypothetical protein JXA09_03520, partial [Anaerolineae bacterium]|nr:hypothetical protein [Anaerolineae bacterium]